MSKFLNPQQEQEVDDIIKEETDTSATPSSGKETADDTVSKPSRATTQPDKETGKSDEEAMVPSYRLRETNDKLKASEEKLKQWDEWYQSVLEAQEGELAKQKSNRVGAQEMPPEGSEAFTKLESKIDDLATAREVDKIEREVADALAKYPDADKDWILTKLYTNSYKTANEAAKAYTELIDKIVETRHKNLLSKKKKEAKEFVEKGGSGEIVVPPVTGKLGSTDLRTQAKEHLRTLETEQ